LDKSCGEPIVSCKAVPFVASAANGALAAKPTPELLLVPWTAARLPVAGLHVELVRGGGELDAAIAAVPGDRWLSLGVVDGRNVWRTDLRAALGTLQCVATTRGTRQLMLAPSCSLLHVPVDLA
jgi:5-methyltetrahydropteroyltriglutamate--homocysteine methyltransferase